MLITSIFASIFSLNNCTSKGTQFKVENRPRPEWLLHEYKDALMIEPFNTVEQDGFFLIDQPIDFADGITPVFFLNKAIPLELFKNSQAFYPELKEFILVVPDWEYYQKVADDAQKDGITIEPTTSNYYYHFSRTNGQLKVDDYYIKGEEQPILDYKIPVISKTENLIVYREEQYGSVCCPKDEKHSLATLDADFVKNYEVQHQVTISGTYRQTTGKEGEHVNYYTLQGMSSAERLAFLLSKNRQWQLKGSGIFNPDEKRIITPKVVPMANAGFTKMQLVAYH
jgi:hypothetical protein